MRLCSMRAPPPRKRWRCRMRRGANRGRRPTSSPTAAIRKPSTSCTRAHARGIEIVVGDFRNYEFGADIFGALVQYPTSDGAIHDYRDFCERAHAANAIVVAAADIMSLVLLSPPGEWGADVCVGSTQ